MHGIRMLVSQIDMTITFTTTIIINIIITRSYAALRAVDLDWIVGPGYS